MNLKIVEPRQSKIPPIVESIEQASAILKVKVAIVKLAKRKGSRAFRSGNRIDLLILAIDLLAMRAEKGSDIPGGFASWKEVLESERALREAIKRKSEEKAVMDTSDAKRQAAEACQFVFNELERGERELPPALAGLSSVECFKRLHSFTEALRKNGQKKFQAIGE